MTVSTTNQGANVKSSVIIAAVKADPTLLAPIAGVDTSKYDISFAASYVLNSKQVQYKSLVAALNGPNHIITEIDGVFVKAVAVVPTTVAYLVDDGVLGIVYSTVDKSLANQQSTTTDASTGETNPTTTDASGTSETAAAAESTEETATVSTENTEETSTASTDDSSSSSDDTSSSKKTSGKSSS